MKPSHILLFAANAFGTGMVTPVLSLLYLSHGATMETIPLCAGILTAMVVLLELPSGIMADLFGKKRTFLLSAASMSLSYLLFLASDRLFSLAAACGLMGASRAFSSGSIEALEIENYMKRHGSQGLEKINSMMAVIQNIGTTLGSITGGFLSVLGDHFKFFLITEILLYMVLFIIAVCFVQETRPEASTISLRIRLNRQLHAIGGCLRHSRPVTVIILTTAVMGMTYCAFELYWQPRLQSLLPPHLGWILGFAICLACLGNSLGNKGMASCMKNSRLSQRDIWRLYWLFRFLFILSAIALGSVRCACMFFLIFTLLYTFAGMGDLIENTIFHSAVDHGQRASMMSLHSLSLRGGGLSASLLGSVIVTRLSADAVWILVPGFAAVLLCGIMAAFISCQKKHPLP